jgi:hypothetical protein
MVMSDAQNRNEGGSTNPLLEPGVLQHVVSYVGPGHYLFVALVSKGWNAIYAALKSQQVTVVDEYRGGHKQTFTSNADMTL